MLPQFVRFKALKEANIVQSWPALKDLIDHEGLPCGRKLSPQIRVWTIDEVNAWIETRPLEPAEPRGLAARRAAEKAARLQHLTEQSELGEADGANAGTRGPPT